MKYATQNNITEWTYTSGKSYSDPFNQVELDVVFTEPDGEERKVPAFWAGDQSWKVRYASSKVGRHRYRTISSDTTNSDLHAQEGVLEIAPYEGSNPLLKHGPLKISANKRYLEHIDGTPFFWLADTWWMGLCQRLSWPGDFQQLAADRKSKGFSVIQIVAGLYPDMPSFDQRGANEAGFPWQEDFSCINPSYFDMADLRIGHLVKTGLVPCIVGCWGYFMEFAGVEVMKKQWRNLLARYGAYPVVWCMAGEAIMLYYLSPANRDQKSREEAIAKARAGWTEATRYLRSIDPYHHPITLHPTDSARNMVDDQSLIDFDMLQTGHGDRNSVPNTVNQVLKSLSREPAMPVINGEVCYEGIGEAARQELQRFMFWVCILSGASGHTYGANGIWQVNRKGQPFGPSPHGMSWGDTPWDEAAQLLGSTQVGLAKRLIERYEWWEFKSHPEWVEPHWSQENYFRPYAAGIPQKVRIIFTPSYPPPNLTIKAIEPNANYRAFYFNPANGEEFEIGEVKADVNGDWRIPKRPPIYQDWILVIQY